MTLDSFFSSRRELSPHGSRLRAGRRSPASPAARRPLFQTAGVNFPPWFTPARRAASPASSAARRPLFKTAFFPGVNFPPWFTPARRAASPAPQPPGAPFFATPEVRP